MFFIVNKTKQGIVISDLKITLGPRQAADLDARGIDRRRVEASKGLKQLVKQGQIEIRRKDAAPEAAYIQPVVESDGFDMGKIKDDILQGVKETMAEMMKAQTPTQTIVAPPQIDQKELAKMIAEMIQIKTGKQEDVDDVIKNTLEEINITVDDETLADIHSRAVDKLVKNVKLDNIRHEEHIEIDNLEQNVSELEGLLD